MRQTSNYYYGARYYDPMLSIFLSVDPLVEKTMTPYQYCNNNPVNLVDPTGMVAESADTFDPESERTAQVIENDIRNKKQQLVSQVGVSNKEQRLQELDKLLNDIEAMRNDQDYEYRIRATPNNQPITFLFWDGIINVEVNPNDMGNVIHESRHGGQIARKEMDINEPSKASYEIDAYNAEFAYNGKIDYISGKKVSEFKKKKVLYYLNYKKELKGFIKTINDFSKINNTMLKDMIDVKGINGEIRTNKIYQNKNRFYD